jgi:hypothetical protein
MHDETVSLILTHLPHIIAPLLGIAFLARFGLYMKRLPPSDLSDDELAAWHAERARSKAAPGRGPSDAAEQPLPR